VNQSFDTSEEEAVKHWRWTENKHAPLTQKTKDERKQEENWGMQDDENYQDKIATEIPGASLLGRTENNKFDRNGRCLEK
jgi:hypothetical protein